jgi:Xaa-Pro aminopeptidase
MVDLSNARKFMTQSGIDAWLLYDFRGSNPVLWHVLGAKKHTTRRCALLIPREGQPRLLAHAIDVDVLADFNIPITRYVAWPQLHSTLREMLAGCSRLAMEYSPGAAIPIVSFVDAGTIELIRALGIEITSSGDLFQAVAAKWDAQGVASHLDANRLINQAKDDAFKLIGQSLSAGKPITEYDVQQFIMAEFAKNNLITEDAPIVGVNANAGNPHYQPSAAKSSPIHKGDWVLIDLWAKHPGERNVYADITWVGFAGPEPSAKHREIFGLVKQARDAAVQHLQQAWKAGEELMGWQVDRVTRDVIDKAGYGQYFFHRTGHSMGPGDSVHALGVNIDDLETHDTRKILPGVGFSIEPGIYLPEFGVRLEIDVFVDPQKGPTVTSSLQTEIVRIL